MDSITPAAIAARVVAWHNRHPLARRITARQVDGIGIVALPCAGLPLAPREKIEPTAPPPDVAPDAGSAQADAAPETASAQADATPDAAAPATAAAPDASPATVLDVPVQADRVLFSEAFMPGTSPRRVARWALLHGVSERPGGADWPVRQIAADPALQQRGLQAGRSPTTLYLITAAIEGRDQRLRVLLGRTAADGALGGRDWSPARMALAALLFTGLIFGLSAGALHVLRMRAAPAAPAAPTAHPPTPAAASKPAPAASPVRPASGAAAASSAHGAHAADDEEVEVEIESPSPAASRATAGSAPAAASVAASAAASTAGAAAASAAAHASRPAAAALSASSAGKASGPSTTAASGAVAHATRASAAAQTGPPAEQPHAPASAASGSVMKPYRVDRVAPTLDPSLQHRLVQEGRALRAGVVPSAPPPRYYALVAKQTATRAESETTLTRYKDTTAKLPGPTKGEVMQTGTSWRAAWWPFFTLEDAEAARKQFERRGAKQLEVVQF